MSAVFLLKGHRESACILIHSNRLVIMIEPQSEKSAVSCMLTTNSLYINKIVITFLCSKILQCHYNITLYCDINNFKTLASLTIT